MEKVLIDPTKALFYRKEAKLSQDELSAKLGASRRLVAGMEDKTSHVELSPYETHLHASALNISAPQLWAEVPEFFRYYGRVINSGEELKEYCVNNGMKGIGSGTISRINEILQSGKLEESTEQNLRTALEDWKRTFA